jgi:hypothetical protein
MGKPATATLCGVWGSLDIAADGHPAILAFACVFKHMPQEVHMDSAVHGAHAMAIYKLHGPETVFI